MLEYEGLELRWTGHDGFQITNSKSKQIIYIDPFQLSGNYKGRKDADIVLISHDHFDHLSIEDLKDIVNANTKIVAADECLEKLRELPTDKITTFEPTILTRNFTLERTTKLVFSSQLMVIEYITQGIQMLSLRWEG
jgi:L-ascorbate metabolism protein UlaG (beta-lactamase superfamily)